MTAWCPALQAIEAKNKDKLLEGGDAIDPACESCQRPAFCEDGRMDDTTKTDEAWRDEWCPTCRGNRQHHKGGDGKWRCHYCHTEANAHTARRLDGAESNKRKLDNVTVSK
jgi:hypothetical protein